MVNLILAILISAVAGFLAGHFTSGGSDASPVSLKEAVTGDTDTAAPKQFLPPRPQAPGRVDKPSAPVMCEAGKTLQEQMGALKFVELQAICREASRDWQRRNIDEYAPAAKHDSGEGEQARRDVFEMTREPAQTSAVWKGEVALVQGDRTVQAEIYVTFYHADDRGEAMRRASFSVDDPLKLCRGISPLFVVNGKGLSTGTMSSCGGVMHKRGDSYYFSWETFHDEALSPIISAILVPVPGAKGSLEYLNSETGQWVADARFHWTASTWQELDEARERHGKKL